MKYTLSIKSSLKPYEVEVLDDPQDLNLKQLGDFLVVDRYFEPFAEQSGLPYLAIQADENSKSLSALESIILNLRDQGLRRGDRLIALGGGVIQDIVTFIASVYMRGLDWVYVPTTLMAMIDSCIGGKSSINVGKVKNLLGTFHPPAKIIINPEFVRTLPKIEIISGLAEAAKICFCRGEEFFARYIQLVSPLLSDETYTASEVAQLIYDVLSAKIWFIEIDEFDQAERRLLNFGHTWGHALEVASNYAVPHGLAIALGMLASTEFLDAAPSLYSDLRNHCKELLSYIPKSQRIYTMDSLCFAQSFKADKKHRNDQIHVILPSQSSDLGVSEICYPMTTDSIQQATNSMQKVLETAW
ncbi:MAG: 3-dehydroquinate synthase [Pseudanabaena sp.]|nr:MAG: 3-dehydroquinate synthase [Pseudanabaena sp.]